MHYKILEAHQLYKNGELEQIAVLYQANELGYVRASYFTRNPVYGYKYLLPDYQLNAQLLQDVAGYGMNLPDDLKQKYFPGERLWER